MPAALPTLPAAPPTISIPCDKQNRYWSRWRLNVVISDNTLSAAEIKTINAGTSGTIDISAATAIPGSTISDILEIVNNTGATFTTADNYAVTVSDAVTLAQLKH